MTTRTDKEYNDDDDNNSSQCTPGPGARCLGNLDAFSLLLYPFHSPDMFMYILLIILNDSKPHIYKLKQARVNNMNINSNCMYCVSEYTNRKRIASQAKTSIVPI